MSTENDSFFCSEELRERITKENLYDKEDEEVYVDEDNLNTFKLSGKSPGEKTDLFLLNFERDESSIRFVFAYNMITDFIFCEDIEDISLDMLSSSSGEVITYRPVLLKISIDEGIITIVCPCNT